VTRPDAAEIARRVAAAGRSKIDRRDLRTGAVDLSPDAIAARRRAGGGGPTGRQLGETAARVFDQAQKLAKIAQRPGRPSRRRRASEQADAALRTAAMQIRLAQLTPLDRGYLHALDLERIQTIEQEVGRAFDRDAAALAVDTHRRINDQRTRVRGGG
jgi:hypothetical protein